MKKLLVVFAAGLGAALALPAAAQEGTNAFYAGGSLGQAHFNNVCGGATFECKDRDTLWSLFAGWQILRYIALEAEVGEFGHVTIDGANAKANAIELDAVGTLPLLAKFSLIGRVGAFHGDMHGEGIANRKNGITYGWGAEWSPTPALGIRFEWQRYPDLGGGPFGAETDVDTTRVAALIRWH
jgi:opacity protein-like surface antigen